MAHQHKVYDTDAHFTINTVTREIPQISKKLVQYDHNSERFTFELSRFVEDHDMSQCSKVEIHYINISGGRPELNHADVYLVDDVQISPDSDNVVIFSWLISSAATQYAGTLNFLIKFTCLTGTTIDYVWSTGIYSGISVASGMNNGEAVVEEYSDVLEAWMQEVLQTIPRIFVRYSANEDGTDFTEEWTEGQKYIGVAIAATAPTDKSEYEWSYFVGNDIFVRYSANADGTNFTENWNTSQMYIGIAVAKTAPTDKSGYKWSLFAPDITAITAETLPNNCINYAHLDSALKKCINPVTNLLENGNGKNGTTGWGSNYGATPSVMDGGGIAYTCTWYGANYSDPAFGTITDASLVSTGDILFQYAEMMTDSPLADMRLAIDNRNAYFVRVPQPPVVGEWYQLYRRHTATKDGATPILYFGRDADLTTGQVVSIKNAMIINLTKTYGAGNEPSNEEMLALIQANGGYIDGTLNLFDAKTMMERQDEIEERVENLEESMPEGVEERLSALENAKVTVPSRLVKNHLHSVNSRTLTGNGSNAQLQTWAYFTFTQGHVYYSRCTISVDSDCEFIVRWGTSAGANGFTTINAEANKVYPVSLCFSAPSASSWSWAVVFASAAESNSKKVTFDGFFLCDLTEEFGEGNEPPAVYMDNLVNHEGIDIKTEYVDILNGGVVGEICARRLRGTRESLYADDQNGVPYVETTDTGNVKISSTPNALWDKWNEAQYSYGMTMKRNVPIYNYVHGVLETDAMFSVQALWGRWTANASNSGQHPYGGHVFEAWNAPRTYRYTVLIGKNSETEACAFTFSPLSGGGGGNFGTLRLGSDITGQGLLCGQTYAEMGGNFTVNGKLNVKQRTIASSTAEGTAGEICFDSNYIYVCVADNTWKRFALETW